MNYALIGRADKAMNLDDEIGIVGSMPILFLNLVNAGWEVTDSQPIFNADLYGRKRRTYANRAK